MTSDVVDFGKLIEYIERKMDEYSSAYFTTTTDFLKWNTAFAVGGILWLSNFVTSSTTKLTGVQAGCASISLLLLLLTIVVSVVIFYFFTNYLNSKWKLHFEWLNCVKNHFPTTEDNQREECRIATELGEQDLPKQIKAFNVTVYLQMSLLIIGYALMIGVISTFIMK